MWPARSKAGQKVVKRVQKPPKGGQINRLGRRNGGPNQVLFVTKKGGKNGSKVKKSEIGRSALGALRQFDLDGARSIPTDRSSVACSFISSAFGFLAITTSVAHS